MEAKKETRTINRDLFIQLLTAVKVNADTMRREAKSGAWGSEARALREADKLNVLYETAIESAVR